MGRPCKRLIDSEAKEIVYDREAWRDFVRERVWSILAQHRDEPTP